VIDDGLATSQLPRCLDIDIEPPGERSRLRVDRDGHRDRVGKIEPGQVGVGARKAVQGCLYPDAELAERP
jgi:hypothetical protein